MQHHEMIAWLGPAAAELTTEQVERLIAEADQIAERHPDDDMAQDAALSAAVQYLLGETRVINAGEALRAARRALDDAMAVSKQLAAMACADGVPDAEAARQAGIDRQTLLRVIGKRTD